MKQAIKVSIGTISFNIDDDAYKVLEDYLNTLKQHFTNSDDSKEIISDIEMRLGELLQMRINNTEEVVSLEDATAIINIMGNPKDFVETDTDESEENTNATSAKETGSEKPKKKLYRDIEDKIVGGVCSGLAHYFRIDAVVFRVAFVLLIVLGINGEGGLVVGTIIAYLILWLVMPKAVNFEQKIRMTGTKTSIANITDRSLAHNKGYKGSAIKDILKFIFKAVLIVTGIFLLINFICFVAFFVWVSLDTNILYAQNYFDLLGLDSFNIKMSIFLFIALPLFGILNLIVKLFRASPFKTQNFVLLALGSGLWIASGVYLGSKGGSFAAKHQNSANVKESVDIATASDVLYIDLGKANADAIQQPSNPYMLYKDNEDIREFAILPLSIYTESTSDSLSSNESYKVEFVSEAYGENRPKAEYEASTIKVDYTITDSLLTINPKWYNKNNPWDLTTTTLRIIVPQGKNVKVMGHLIGVNIYSH